MTDFELGTLCGFGIGIIVGVVATILYALLQRDDLPKDFQDK